MRRQRSSSSIMRRIYLSSRWGRRAELRAYRDELIAMGHDVTSRWLDAPPETPQTDWSAACEMCLFDICSSDVFVAFTEAPITVDTRISGDLMAYRGARHAELGYALSCGWMDVLLVGDREHVLHHAAGIQQFDTWAEARQWIGGGR